MNTDLTHSGWVIGRSIALELDIAVSFTCGRSTSGILPEEFVPLVQSFPPEWRAEYIALFGEPREFQSTLEPAALLAGTLMEEDYGRATLPVRELSIAAALERLAAQAAAYALQPDPALAPARQLVDLQARLYLALFNQVGFQLEPQSPQAVHQLQEFERGVRLLQGGDLHERYWQWLDRFYYEFYRPWRNTRQSLLETQEQRAITVLGVKERKTAVAEIGWLPEQNPILRYPELNAGVCDGRLGVFFWVEPFGLADTWLLCPGQVVISFAEPGPLFANFFEYTTHLAARVQALADPTRLVILRLIRNIGMTNTDMAAYLKLTRPTVSIHARILREAGLIRSHQEGRIMRHEIVPQELRRMFGDLERFLDLPEDEEQAN